VERAGHRQAEAAAGVGDRLRDAIPDIRVVTRDDLRKLRREIERLAKRVEELERRVAKPAPARRTKTTRASKPAARRATRSKR
jgi:hypothetical protein